MVLEVFSICGYSVKVDVFGFGVFFYVIFECDYVIMGGKVYYGVFVVILNLLGRIGFGFVLEIINFFFNIVFYSFFDYFGFF